MLELWLFKFKINFLWKNCILKLQRYCFKIDAKVNLLIIVQIKIFYMISFFTHSAY